MYTMHGTTHDRFDSAIGLINPIGEQPGSLNEENAVYAGVWRGGKELILLNGDSWSAKEKASSPICILKRVQSLLDTCSKIAHPHYKS